MKFALLIFLNSTLFPARFKYKET